MAPMPGRRVFSIFVSDSRVAGPQVRFCPSQPPGLPLVSSPESALAP